MVRKNFYLLRFIDTKWQGSTPDWDDNTSGDMLHRMNLIKEKLMSVAEEVYERTLVENHAHLRYRGLQITTFDEVCIYTKILLGKIVDSTDVSNMISVFKGIYDRCYGFTTDSAYVKNRLYPALLTEGKSHNPPWSFHLSCGSLLHVR